MRVHVTRETLSAGIPIAVLLALGACSTSGSGETANNEASTGMPVVQAEQSAIAELQETESAAVAPASPRLDPVGAIIRHGRDHTNREVGVPVYRGPLYTRPIDTRDANTYTFVLCKTPGRTFVDTDVPDGKKPIVSKEWYLMNEEEPHWIGGGNLELQGKVPKCPPFAMKAATEAPQPLHEGDGLPGPSNPQAPEGYGVYQPWVNGQNG